MLLRSRTRNVPGTLWADGIIAALAVLLPAPRSSSRRCRTSASGQALEVAVNLAYPLTDLVLLGVIVGALAGTGWQLDRTWVMLFAGVATFWLADSLYLVGNANGTYVPGSWFDVGWWLGLFLIGSAAWQPVRPALDVAAAGERLRADRRAALLRHCRPRPARLRQPHGPQPARRHAWRGLARGGDGAHDAHLPRQRRDAARLSRGGADRLADRPPQPARAHAQRSSTSWSWRPPTARSCSPSSISTASSTTTTRSATRPGDALLVRLGASLSGFLTGAAPRSAWAETSSARSSPRRRRCRRAADRAALPPRCPSTARASRSAAPTARSSCPSRHMTSPTRCGSPTSACTRRRTPAACRRAGRRRTCCCARSPSATPSCAPTSSGVADLAEATARRLELQRRRRRPGPPCRRAARRRQGRDPRCDPHQARAARRGRVGVHPPPHADRRADRGRGAGAQRAWPRSSARATSAGTEPATRTASPASTSRSAPGSSPSRTRSTR